MLVAATLAMIIGCFLGLCELLARYRDEPVKAVSTPAAWAYILINGVAALAAVELLDVFHVTFDIDPADPDRIIATRVLVGGLGAMAFFRSSLFTFRLGDKDVPLGPGLVLQVLLDVTDRQVDRGRAGKRAATIVDIMKEVDFDKAKLALPAYCFGIMQNVGTEEQSEVGDQVAKLDRSTISGPIRTYLLGLVLMNLLGEAVLRAAIKSLNGSIKTVTP